jgi:nitrate/nitrite transporter NarK
LFAPVAVVWRMPNLRRLAIVSFVFGASQTCFTAFLVVCLVQRTGLDLAAAGAVLAIGQVAGAIGRIAWGGLADATGRPLLTLAAIGAGMTGGLLALAQIDAGWPFVGLAAVSIVSGATAVGWNGVFYAEIAQQAPRGQAAAMTGGVVFVTYLGPLLGPALFSAVLAAGGSYGLNFTVLAIADAGCALVLLRMARTPSP